MFMQTANKFVQAALGDWQTAGILSLHSGLPYWVSSWRGHRQYRLEL